eukprot:g7854.t1
MLPRPFLSLAWTWVELVCRPNYVGKALLLNTRTNKELESQKRRLSLLSPNSARGIGTNLEPQQEQQGSPYTLVEVEQEAASPVKKIAPGAVSDLWPDVSSTPLKNGLHSDLLEASPPPDPEDYCLSLADDFEGEDCEKFFEEDVLNGQISFLMDGNLCLTPNCLHPDSGGVPGGNRVVSCVSKWRFSFKPRSPAERKKEAYDSENQPETESPTVSFAFRNELLSADENRRVPDLSKGSGLGSLSERGQKAASAANLKGSTMKEREADGNYERARRSGFAVHLIDGSDTCAKAMASRVHLTDRIPTGCEAIVELVSFTGIGKKVPTGTAYGTEYGTTPEESYEVHGIEVTVPATGGSMPRLVMPGDRMKKGQWATAPAADWLAWYWATARTSEVRTLWQTYALDECPGKCNARGKPQYSRSWCGYLDGTTFEKTDSSCTLAEEQRSKDTQYWDRGVNHVENVVDDGVRLQLSFRPWNDGTSGFSGTGEVLQGFSLSDGAQGFGKDSRLVYYKLGPLRVTKTATVKPAKTGTSAPTGAGPRKCQDIYTKRNKMVFLVDFALLRR